MDLNRLTITQRERRSVLERCFADMVNKHSEMYAQTHLLPIHGT